MSATVSAAVTCGSVTTPRATMDYGDAASMTTAGVPAAAADADEAEGRSGHTRTEAHRGPVSSVMLTAAMMTTSMPSAAHVAAGMRSILAMPDVLGATGVRASGNAVMAATA